METMNINMGDFGNSQKRQMPIVLLLDASDSMKIERRIDALNRGVRGLFTTLAKTRTSAVEFYVAVIVFKDKEAYIHQEYKPLRDMQWTDIQESGCTPLASALHKAKDIIEDTSKLSTKSYRPTVILISDGYPTDDDSEWQEEMRRFTKEGRSAKADRFALSVTGAAKDVLKQFVVNEKSHMMDVEDVSMIIEFMRWLSQSISQASTSQDPNKKSKIDDLTEEVHKQAQEPDPDFGNIDINSINFEALM